MKRPDMERVTQMVQQGNEEMIPLHGKKGNIYESNNTILVNCQIRKMQDVVQYPKLAKCEKIRIFIDCW